MLAAAAVCPHPPLLVPEVATGAASETQGLRRACLEAVAVLTQARPDVVVVVGDAPQSGGYPEGSVGSLAPYGVDLTVRLGRGVHEPDPSGEPLPSPAGPLQLPLSLTIGAWLLGHLRFPGACLAHGVAADTGPDECVRLGSRMAGQAGRVALLIMGDGSARRSEKAPGYLDGRAEAFDNEVARALGAADTKALLALDVRLATELLVAGRASWQVLAGAVQDGQEMVGRLLSAQAPYGVGYAVATWSLPPDRALDLA